MKTRIYYEDTDIGGITYHTNYIKFCERARSEIFFKYGIMPTLGDGSGFVVKNISADFKGTSTLGDMLDVTTKIKTLKSSSVVLTQEVLKSEKSIFSMDILLVYVEGGKPCRIPEKFKEVFLKLESK